MSPAAKLSIPRAELLDLVRVALTTLTDPGDTIDVPSVVTEVWLRSVLRRQTARTGLRYRVNTRPTVFTVTARPPLDVNTN